MDLIQLEKTIEFRTNKPELYKKALLLTSDFMILVRIYENIKIFNRVERSGCMIFVDLVRAIFALENLPDESILIQFTELNLYGIFTGEQYLNFIRNVGDDIEDYDLSVNLYQVVISGKKQKLVFACTDFAYFDKLQNYARDCFSADVSKSSNQLTVNIVTQNEDELADNYNKLYNFISNRNDQPCCESMKQIQLLQQMHYKFRKYSCNDTLSARNMEDLIRALKSANINAPIVIGDYNNVIIGSHNHQVAPAPAPKRDTQEWIRFNPPDEKEITTDYYARYRNAIHKPMHINQFGKIVENFGFTKKSNGRERYWIRYSI